MKPFRSVDSSRQEWEDQVNESFEKIKSSERVCWHADCTVTRRELFYLIECDYCPAREMYCNQVPPVLQPFYFHDPDPLMILFL